MPDKHNSILDNDYFRSQLSSILCSGKESQARGDKVTQMQELDDKALSAFRAIFNLGRATVKEVCTQIFISKDSGYRICKDLEAQGFLIREEDSSKYPNVKPTIYYSVSPNFREILLEGLKSKVFADKGCCCFGYR